ncbi:uncharacterized protein [Ptychodera flava]|uniref:uncharacterized protein n=1 Tax=Ptychodera flava TaxID=63121 RepID=UPI00396A9AF8
MSDTSTEDTDDDTHDERLKLVIKELEETHGLLEVKDLEIDAMQEKMKELKAIAEDKQGQLLSTQEELNEMQNLAEERLEHIQVLKEHFIEVHSTLNSDTDVASSHEILLSTSDGTISEEAVAIASSSLNHISRLQDELQEAQHIIEVKNRHIEVLLNTINADEETDMTKSKVGRQQSSKQDKDVKLTIENELLEAKVEIEYLREELLQNKKLAGDRGKEIKSLQQNYESVQKQLQSRHNLIESLNNQVENVTMMLETKVSENEDLKSLLNAQIEGKESANHEDLLRKDREIEQLRREVDISKTLAEQRKEIIWNLQNKQGKNDADDESTYDVKLQSKIDGFKALLESKDSMIKNLESKLADIHLAKTESDPSVLNRIEHMEGLLKLKEADNEALQREVLAIRKLAGHRLHDINSLTRKYSALKQTENNSDSLTKTLQLQLQNLSMVLIARDDEIERLRIELKSVTDGQKQHDKVSSSMDEQYTALQDELKATKVDNEALERELLYSRKLAEQRSQEINSLSRKHSTTEQVANDSKTLAKNLQLQMRGLISQLETKDQKIAEIQSKLAEANKSLAVASLSSQQMNVEAAIHKADSKDFVDSMTMKLYELRKVISDHLVTITSLKSELQQSKKSSGEKDAQIQMIMNETRDHQIELEKRIEKMQEQLESMANKTGDQKIDSVIRLLQDDLIIAKSELHKKEHELEKRISDHGRETQILQNQLQHMSQELGNSSFYSSQKYRDMRELFENQLSEACKTAKENCEKYDTLVKDSENVKQELQKRIEELELQLIKTQSTKVLAESNTQAGINHRKDLECELIKSEQQRLQLEMEIQQLQKQLPISESQKAAIAMQAELSSGADGINMAEQHLLQGVRNDSTSILINSLKNELLSQKNELRKKNDDVDQMMKSHESDSKVLRSQIEILKQQLQQVSQQSKMDRTDEKELESLQRYQNIMKESDKEKQQLQKDIQDLQLQLVKAEAKANTQVLIDSDISLKKEVEHAKELLAEKDVQLKQLVKESQQQYADMQKEIQLLQIKQIESGAEIVDHGKDNAITALQQELAIARKVIKEKDDHLQLVTQESQKQLSELQRQLQEMYVKSVDTRHVADANKDALHEMQHIKDELAILRSSTKDSTENSVLKVQFDNVKQEYGRHLKELETLREDYISTKRLSSERRRKIENVEEELAEMKDLAKSQNMNERALLEELTVIKSLVDVKEKQNNALQENLDSSRFALKQQEDNIAKMRQQIEELQETVKEKKQKINLLSANQQQSQNTFQKMASDRLAIMQKAEAAKSTIHTQKQRIESLEKTVDEANRNVEQKQREIDTLRDNLKVANKTACERSHALVQMKGNVADVGVLADDRQRQTMELLEDLENKETLTREQQIQIKMLKQDVTRTHQTVKDKNREIWQLKQELDDATDIALFRETESTNIHSEFEETKRLAEDRKRQVESLDKLLEDSQLSVQTKDSENVNLQQELARSESISLEQKQEIGTLKDKVQSLTGTVHDLSRQNKESNDKLRSSSRVLADQEKKIQQMEAQLKDIRAKFDEKDRELDNIAHNMDISMNVAEERLNKLKAMAQEIKNLHKEIKDRDKSIKTLQHELHSLKSHSENKERKAEALSGKTEGFKRLAEERGSQVSSLQKDLETLKEIARNKQGQLDSIQDSLIKQTAEYKSQNEQVTQLLNQKNSMEERLQTLTNDLQNNAKELATAKEINQTLFYDKCKSESERKQSEDELIAVRHLLESEKDVHRAEMAAINSELQQSKEHIRNAERTKEQLTTTLDEVKEQLTEDLNRANRKSEKLGNQLADCEAELGLLKNNYNLVCSALETERKDVEALKRQCKLAEDTRYALEEKVKDLTIYVETSKLTIDAGKEQFEMLEREKQSLLGDIHSMQETLTEKERLISETKVTCQQSIEDLNRKHQQKLLQGDKIRGDIQCRFDELQERCEVLKTQVEKRNVQLVNYGKTLRDLDSTRSSNKELENRIDGLEAELEKTRLLVKDTKAELANKEQSLENATQALAKSKNVNGDLREELKRQRLTAAKAIGDKDKEKSELDQTLTNIKSSLEDTKWNCSTLTNSNALLESDKRHLADTVDRLQNELKTETQHRILAEKVAADREFEIKEYKRDQDLLHENLGKLRDDIGKLERLLQEEKKRIDRLKNEKESLKSLASVMDSRASGLVQKINHYQSELTKTRKKMQSRCRTLKEEDEQVILDLHDKLNVLQEEKEKNSEQLCKTMKELEETRDHTFKKNEQCHKLKKTVSELENEKKDLKFDLKKAEDALKVETALQERLSLRNQELESELVRLRNALGKLQEQSMLHQHQSPSASTAKDQSSELRTIISELSKQIKKQANAKTTDNSVKDKCTVSQLQSDLNREKTFRAVEQQQLRAANEEIEHLRDTLNKCNARKTASSTPERSPRRRLVLDDVTQIVADSQTRAAQTLALQQSMMGSSPVVSPLGVSRIGMPPSADFFHSTPLSGSHAQQPPLSGTATDAV